MNPPALLPFSIREDFPLLSRQHPTGCVPVYFDSAGTSLKPESVIQAVSGAMALYSGNVHGAVHFLGDEATELFEGARRKVARLIGAESHEVVFLHNTTEALNLVARCYPRKGRVLVSLGEHHSNLLPWGQEDAKLIPPRPDGTLDEEVLLRELARGGVGIVTVSHVSNVTGMRTNVRRLADAAHAAGAVIVLDGAQSVPHMPIDVQVLDCDFLAFSSHKMCGPSGVGALFGKAERLAELSCLLKGGGMADQVRRNGAMFKQPPWRFEAGTPPIEAAIGFGAASDYLQHLRPERVEGHVRLLRAQARERLRRISGVRILGPEASAPEATGPLSFTVSGTSSHVIARHLSDGYGICIPSGYHCAQPLHDQLKLAPTLRLSFYVYNQPAELDRFFDALTTILSLGCRLG